MDKRYRINLQSLDNPSRLMILNPAADLSQVTIEGGFLIYTDLTGGKWLVTQLRLKKVKSA